MNHDLKRPENRAAILTRLGFVARHPRGSQQWQGGRAKALEQLHQYDLSDYARTRNQLDAPVSRLSPYLRHGMISVVEARDHLRERYAQQPERLEEFLRQLAWRDFFEKVLAWHGRGLHENLEDPKHSVARASRIPLDVVRGETGLPCMDGILDHLFTDGYLHNHERLWFAAYLCHFRGISWQAGAQLFRQYLYDGDYASNSSSWQWVESSFASKPYFMNRENIAKFSANRWCANCQVNCPFDAEYPTLQHRLFGGTYAPMASKSQPSNLPETPFPIESPSERLTDLSRSTDLVWLHDAALSDQDAAILANPTATIAFVFDEPALRLEPWAHHRLNFVMDGITEVYDRVPNSQKLVLVGDLASQLTATARQLGAETIHISEHPNPAVVETAEQLRKTFRVVVHPRPALTEYNQEPRRFSRYWERVSEQVLGYRAKPKHRLHS
jgi:deoxyribodipyrimidine photo-lyase